MEAITNQNFISVDKKTARNSYGEFFSVGETVGHDGAADTATILSFEAEVDNITSDDVIDALLKAVPIP